MAFKRATSNHARLSVLLGSLLLVTCHLASVSAGEDRAADPLSFRVAVFDCYMSIPSEFVLNTHEKVHFAFIHQLSPQVRITVSGSDAISEEDFELRASDKIGGLSVREMAVPKSKRGSGESIFVIGDGQQTLAIFGSKREFADELIASCLKTKRR